MNSPAQPSQSHQSVNLSVLFLVATILFALAYGQAPLYFSNQHQYFLHGLAQGGKGRLNEDWLAKTADPTPVFTAIVAFTYRFLDVRLFHVYYALLMGVYIASLIGFFVILSGERFTLRRLLVFLAFVILVHSAMLRATSTRLFGVDYPWYFQAGVAGQYVLGPMLQPSAFGVLLLASLFFFAKERPLLAVICSSLGAVCHGTYLLLAAMLTIAYLAVLLGQRQPKRALLIGSLALVIVSPVVVYNLVMFRPTSVETFAEAQNILVHFRIPHHAVPRLWLDPVAVVQVGWIVVGMLCARGSRLFPVMVTVFSLSLLLSMVQVVTNNNTLALLFPWRASVLLVPAATAIILTRVVNFVADRVSAKEEVAGSSGLGFAGVISVLIIVALASGGTAIMYYRLAFQTRDEELAMMNHVRDNSSAGDVYLIPLRVPNIEANLDERERDSFLSFLEMPASSISDFVPLPVVEGEKRFIPLNLQRFRLYTGAPIYVDFKSIPYRDVDVIAWRMRLQNNQRMFATLSADDFRRAHEELQKAGITHVVVPAQISVRSDLFRPTYHDAYYRVYELRGG